MSANQRLKWVPEIETGLSTRTETLLLGFALIVGLTFVVPLLSVLLGIPALVFVVVVGALYGVVALLFRQLLVGSFVAFIVTAVFGADVPLASTEYLNSITGALGPQLRLVHLPLVAMVVLVLAVGPRKAVRKVTLAEVLFGAFVGWSALAAVFGATARTDVALYFSLLMAQVLVILVLFRYLVQTTLRFRTVAELFAGTVLAQSLFAVGQTINGGTFGVSTLGESGEEVISTFSLGPFGTLSAGTYVSGFTGGQFILASLIVLAVPILFGIAIESREPWRTGSVGGALLMVAVLRATAGDAARGGLLVAGAFFLASVVYLYRSRLWERTRRLVSGGDSTINGRFGRSLLYQGVVAVSSLALALYPSSASGASSRPTDVNSGSGTTTASTNSSQPTTTVPESGGQSTSTPAGRVTSLLEDLSIPLFSLSNLGTRVRQYLAGLDLFVKHPLFGIGGGNFRYYATGYGLPHPLPLHNVYIALLAETGLPGFILYISTLGLLFLYGTRAATDGDSGNVVLVGVLCGLVGYFAFGFFDILQLIKPTAVFPFGLLAGAVLGQYRNAIHR